MNNQEENTRIYKVVINQEEQDSMGLVDRENALGWQNVGKSDSKEERLDDSKEIWTDMRPLNPHNKMEEAEHGDN